MKALIRSVAAAVLLAGCATAKPAEKPAEPAPAPVVAPVAKPEPAPAPTAPDEPFRAQKPEPSPIPPKFQAPVPIESTLASGARLLVVENHNVPLVSLEVVVRAGVDAEPEGKGGIAGFAASMLTEGTAKRPALEFAAKVEDLAARLGASADLETARLRMNCLTETLPEALDLLAEALVSPAFRAEDVERQRGILITGLLQKKASPSALAADEASRLIYGEKHPRGRPAGGTPETVKAITRADLLKFHETWYRPQTAVISVSGDVVTADFKKLLEAKLAAWKKKATPALKLPQFPKVAARTVTLVDKPAASQSQVWVIGELFPSKHPDRVPMAVLNNIFGGLFGSRLNLNLREAKGYSYGVRSGIRLDSDRGWLLAAGGVQSKVTAEALAEYEKEISAMATGELREGELAKAKEALVRGLPAQLETNDAVAAAISTVAIQGLPLDWYKQIPERVGKVEAADVARVAAEYLKADKMPVVIVGPRAEFEEKIKALGLGVLDAK